MLLIIAMRERPTFSVFDLFMLSYSGGIVD